jgi:hypothetical protein
LVQSQKSTYPTELLGFSIKLSGQTAVQTEPILVILTFKTPSEAQTPITTTQHLLGHSQLKTTQGYTHLANRQAHGQRSFHFRNTQPPDPALTPFADWLPANKKICCVSRRALNRSARTNSWCGRFCLVFCTT